MKKSILLLLFVTKTVLNYGQVTSVVFESKDNEATYNELKNATVHVIIKDFCDDSKPYKKILEDNWKHSKLIYDYSEKYDWINQDGGLRGLCKEGEWYMFLERSIGQKGTFGGGGIQNSSHYNFSNTEISIAKVVGKKRLQLQYVIKMPIYPAPGKEYQVGYPSGGIQQNVDVAKSFFNLSNEFYLLNTIQVLNQFVEKQISYWMSYDDKELNCESLKEVLKSTLYIPQYVLVKSSRNNDKLAFVDGNKYFKGYESNYKMLTNEEMVKKFKSGEQFYYLLYSVGYGKWNFIVEGTTGKIMSISGDSKGYNIDENDMSDLYNNLKNNKKCK